MPSVDIVDVRPVKVVELFCQRISKLLTSLFPPLVARFTPAKEIAHPIELRHDRRSSIIIETRILSEKLVEVIVCGCLSRFGLLWSRSTLQNGPAVIGLDLGPRVWLLTLGVIGTLSRLWLNLHRSPNLQLPDSANWKQGRLSNDIAALCQESRSQGSRPEA